VRSSSARYQALGLLATFNAPYVTNTFTPKERKKEKYKYKHAIIVTHIIEVEPHIRTIKHIS